MRTIQCPQIALQSPLVSVDVACAALKKDRSRVMALIDEGSLAWAFNLALSPDGRCEPRILSVCLADCQQGQPTRWPAGVDEFAAVLKLVFPMVTAVGEVAHLRAATVRRQLAVSAFHFLNLCDTGWIKLVKGTRRCGGPDGSPLVEFQSVADFLKRRRIV
jgi:hypothetical protein